jgi:hypothetical protein
MVVFADHHPERFLEKVWKKSERVNKMTLPGNETQTNV